MYLLEKIQLLSKRNFFLIFFFLILITRVFFLQFSLSNYPWFYEWQHIEYFIKLKESDYSFVFSHSIRNQFQIFTKILYLIFFNISGFIWESKVWSLFLQIIPALTLGLTITFLFYNKIRSIWLLFGLFLFSAIPPALSNFYHFSESHFYFQLLIMITSFIVYEKYNGFKSFFLILILFVFSIFNMAAVTIIFFLIYIFFYFLKYIIEKDKKYFIYSFLISIALVIYYFVSYKLQISSIFETSQTADISIKRSLYLIVKGFFHQNNIFFGLFLVSTFAILFANKSKNLISEFKKNNFLIFLMIFSVLSILSISIGKNQIYDRYKDFFQISGLLSIYLFTFMTKNKIFRYFLTSIIILLISYNSLFFLNKFNLRVHETKIYDKSIDLAIKNYKEKNITISKEKLHFKAKRFPIVIMSAVDNELF